MNSDELNTLLSNPVEVSSWLQEAKIADVANGQQAIQAMIDHGLPGDLLGELLPRLAHHLPQVSDPDLALHNLSRFIGATSSPLSFGSMILQEDASLRDLLSLFATSELFAEMLIQDPAALDLIRATEGAPAERESLARELCDDVAYLSDADDVAEMLFCFRRRETLRIAYGDIIVGQSPEIVSEQLTILAEAVCEAALQFALRETMKKRGVPSYGQGSTASVTMLGLRRFGGRELDYEDHLDVLFIYDRSGRTTGERPISNHEFFSKVAQRTTQLLDAPLSGSGPNKTTSPHSPQGTSNTSSDESPGQPLEQRPSSAIYQLDVRRATGFQNDQFCGDIDSAIKHFDSSGRTWERMALIKARPVAGAFDLGYELLDAIEPWIYRRYLSRSDISGIRALQRRLVRRSDRQGLQMLDVEGGILDLEFTVQFLQLINGGDDRQLRTGNTLQAIRLLEQNGAVTSEEAKTLEDNYQWMRRLEHRLEVIGDTKPSQLPEQPDDVRRLAVRCGYEGPDAAEAFQGDYDRRISENKQAIAHLLEDAFDDAILQVDAETDLVMDPDPRPETVRNILSPYRFRDTTDAFHQLSELGRERIPFLSTRRCRYFLSLISRPLLFAISKTPAPDATLANLVRVSDSLGGKGVLWELFHSQPSALDLYVRLCSSSPYLTAILTRYPGMIDELLDSLMLEELPTLSDMHGSLEELARTNANDLDAILHSFKNTLHLNVGVRDLLGQVDVRQSTRALADVAEACLQRVAHHEYQNLLRKLGEPRIDERPCGFVLLGMGKLGGREPNYHSDADFVLLFEADGDTYHPPTIRHRDTTSNQHFFGELSKRTVKAISENRSDGKLYDSDPIRPIGKAGPASVSLDRFREYFLNDTHPFASIREVCRARPIYGPEPLRARATEVLQEILQTAEITELDRDSVRSIRRQFEATAGPRNLKRGPGGTLDVEFIVQALQLRNSKNLPQVLQANSVDALASLAEHNVITQQQCIELTESYLYLRQVEAMLRLLNTTARHDLPRERDELDKLSYLMRCSHVGQLERDCAVHTKRNRAWFQKLI